MPQIPWLTELTVAAEVRQFYRSSFTVGVGTTAAVVAVVAAAAVEDVKSVREEHRKAFLTTHRRVS